MHSQAAVHNEAVRVPPQQIILDLHMHSKELRDLSSCGSAMQTADSIQ